jgi:L-lysine exporter family protein LysE/ArgO
MESYVAALQGFVLQSGLILALGAQNIFVLESGLKRRKHWHVAALCSACDAALISFGVFGAGVFFLTYPGLQAAMGAAGVAFLIWYAILKLREGLSEGQASETAAPKDLRRPLAAALAFSLLNPHVYLDTVVLIGGYSTQFEATISRAAFGAGAAAFSTIWFFALVGLAARMSVILSSAAGRRAIALGSAAILFTLSLALGAEVWSWIRALL